MLYTPLVIFLSACLSIQAETHEPHADNLDKKPITITVWVHGSLVGPNFIFHDFFYRRMGMVRAQDYHHRYHSRDMALSLCTADPDSYHMEHFYFWGWSGKLSRGARATEAQTLYTDLKTLIAYYKKACAETPLRLRLISHSHGGNVLLNLCQAQDETNPLVFDELILLACPVQFATKEYVHSDCFKKIYSFYSADLYQVIDFQRTKKNGKNIKMHSDRRFQEVPNLRQAKIKINGWALTHVEFMLDKFLKHVPRLCKELDAFYESLDSDKKHREKLLHIQSCKHTVTVRKKVF